MIPESTHYRIDLNTADSATLELLPGIGPGLASNIIAHRQQIDGFQSVEQLIDVHRIGPATFQKIHPWVIVTPRPDP